MWRILLIVPLDSRENKKVLILQKTVSGQGLGTFVQEKTKLDLGSVSFSSLEAVRNAVSVGKMQCELHPLRYILRARGQEKKKKGQEKKGFL